MFSHTFILSLLAGCLKRRERERDKKTELSELTELTELTQSTERTAQYIHAHRVYVYIRETLA